MYKNIDIGNCQNIGKKYYLIAFVYVYQLRIKIKSIRKFAIKINC